ncbi:MAG: hypothetical protein GX161_14675 [Firmicutes bacterium]|jgi:sugar phosphate isomerase/epimerase|nr:hypothetical protein [Bacillota bacterium]
MKLAIHFSLREPASLSDEELVEFGLRGVEVPAGRAATGLPAGLKPCLFDAHVVLGDGNRVDVEMWDGWFRAARARGAQGVAAAVRVEPDTVDEATRAVLRLGELAFQRGTRLLLTVRTGNDPALQASYVPLISWCERLDGRGIGIVLDVEAAGLLGDDPRQLLREAHGYVQHVRVPSPAWRCADEAIVAGVMRELHRVSYIDYVSLYGQNDPDVPMAEAIDALRQAAVRAWV